jgi:hypothetical protein
MTYLDGWKAISSWIHDLKGAGFVIGGSDSFGMAKHLSQQCRDIFTELERFRKQFDGSLPPAAVAAIDGFLAKHAALFKNPQTTSGMIKDQARTALVFLSSFNAQATYLLSNTQEELRSRVDRAFLHLQRLIVVDPDTREKWRRAFDDGETASERLGAVHLLLHGIWAFKISGEGERTDLVFSEPMTNFADQGNSVEGLVLTEWKKSNRAGQDDRTFEAARKQAHRYGIGVLAATELAAYRYAVVVSQDMVVSPPDIFDNGIIYRHVNIAVAPRSPSKS